MYKAYICTGWRIMSHVHHELDTIDFHTSKVTRVHCVKSVTDIIFLITIYKTYLDINIQ